MSSNQTELAMLDLIQNFISGNIAAEEFEEHYSTLWRRHRDSVEPKTADADTQRYFDSVFSAVDAYCSDPELFDEDDLDDRGLVDAISILKAAWEKSVLA